MSSLDRNLEHKCEMAHCYPVWTIGTTGVAERWTDSEFSAHSDHVNENVLYEISSQKMYQGLIIT